MGEEAMEPSDLDLAAIVTNVPSRVVLTLMFRSENVRLPSLTATQCRLNGKFLSRWFPQSPILAAFQTACGRVGAAQAWNLLQGLLGVPATGKNHAGVFSSPPIVVFLGALNQATFQALLANTNQALLAQQLLALAGATGKLTGK